MGMPGHYSVLAELDEVCALGRKNDHNMCSRCEQLKKWSVSQVTSTPLINFCHASSNFSHLLSRILRRGYTGVLATK